MKSESDRIEELNRLARLSAPEAEGIDALEAEVARALADEAVRVVHAAVSAIGSLAYRGVARFDEKVVEELIHLAAHEAHQIRAEVAVTLAILSEGPNPKVRRTLEQLLEDDAPAVRREAAAGLGDLKDPQARGALIKHLEDSDAQTRFESSYALACLQDSSGLDQLIAALGNPTIRMDALEALRKLDDRRAVEPVSRLARSTFLPWPDRLMARATLYALGEIGAAELVIARTRAFSGAERELALALIGSFGIREGIGVVRSVAARPKDRARGTAIRALGDIGDPSDRAFLETVLSDPKTPAAIREDATEALERLS